LLGLKPKLHRDPYRYRRNLPHFTKADRAHFITFHTWKWWIFPPDARSCVLSAFRHFDGERYKLFAVVVMPEHVHAILVPERNDSGDPRPLSDILQSIKSYTAHQIAKMCTRKLPVWESESLDHVLRHEESLEEKIEYIRQNPVRRGLVSRPEDYEWLWIRLPS
jgi:REP element-mobilizing transposase RayT